MSSGRSGAGAGVLGATCRSMPGPSFRAPARRALASGTVASRGAFQRDLGCAHAMLGAVRDHAARLLGEVRYRRMAGEHTPPSLEAELRAAATLATGGAVDVAHMALRCSGGTGVRNESAIQRVLREVLVAQSHVHVVDTNYDNLGLARLRDAGAEGLDAVRAGYRRRSGPASPPCSPGSSWRPWRWSKRSW